MIWLAAVAAGCTVGPQLAAAGAPAYAASPAPDQPTASPAPATPSAAANYANPSPRSLAGHAYAYVIAVQRGEQAASDADLAPTVCPLTFNELEFAAPWSARYQADPTLTAFLTAATAIDWNCARRDRAAIRSGVRGLSALLPSLAALQAQ